MSVGVAVWNLPKILNVIKRVAGFPAEIRLQSLEAEAKELALRAEVLDAEVKIIDAQERRDAAHAVRHGDRLEAAGYRIVRVVVAAEDDDNILQGGR